MSIAAAHRFLEHTGEVEFELQAPSRDALFTEAVAAIGELLAGRGGSTVTDLREVSAVGDDDGALLVAWLDEIVFLAENEGLMPVTAEQVHVAHGAVTGLVRAIRGAPPHLVKGITYHHLAVDHDATGWRARVVVDV